MPNNTNIETVKSLKEKASKAKSVVFTDYLGISAQQANELRNTLKDNDAEIIVTKNTLMGVALEDKMSESQKEENLKGPTAVVFSYSDPISAIKTLFSFAKNAEFFKIKAAIVEGTFKDGDAVEEIKDIPSKEELLSKVVYSLKHPITGFTQAMGGVQRKFVYAIKALSDKKEQN